ncbi:DUF1090 family protein [Salmonella enterica]|nr:DUF1090 family protein [Salmonella enterica]
MKPQYLRATILVGLLYPFIVSGAMAGYQGCEYKHQQPERQSDYARENINIRRVTGLLEALSQVDEHCT